MNKQTRSSLFKIKNKKYIILNPTYPQSGKKSIHLEKVLPGTRQAPKSFLMCYPISTFNYQLRAARILGSCNSPFPQGNLLSSPLSKVRSLWGCGFHLLKPVPLWPHTGELARWCLLQSSVSASIRGVLTSHPLAPPPTLQRKWAETKCCRLVPSILLTRPSPGAAATTESLLFLCFQQLLFLVPNIMYKTFRQEKFQKKR